MKVISWGNLLVLLCFEIAFAEIIRYDYHVIDAGRPEYLIVPKYDKGDVPQFWLSGEGRSFIDLSRLDIVSSCFNDSEAPAITRDKGLCQSVSFDVLLFEAVSEHSEASWMDHWPDGRYCCTLDLVYDGKCSAGRLIVPESLPSHYYRSVTVQPYSEKVPVEEDRLAKHPIKSSGLYVLLMAQCTADTAPLYLQDSIYSLDPYGYLPADLFGGLPFYLTLNCISLIFGVIWMVVCLWNSDRLTGLQYWISAVLLIAVIESGLLLSHYLYWNQMGTVSIAILMTGLLFGVTKRVLSRVLLQLVSLGNGVVRKSPISSDDMRGMLCLGGVNFVLSLLITTISNLTSYSPSRASYPYNHLLSLIPLLLLAVDIIYCIRIFSSINSLIQSLSSREEGDKQQYLLLALYYCSFRRVLFALLSFSCVWVLSGSVMFLNDNYWRYRWAVDALWNIFYLLIFVSIAILQRYAFSSSSSTSTSRSTELTRLVIVYPTAVHSFLNTSMAEKIESDGLSDQRDPLQETRALLPASIKY